MLYLLNGPPRSGKDTVSSFIHWKLGGLQVKLAWELKERTHGAYSLFDEEGKVLSHDSFEAEKDQPRDDFLGLTPREAYIGFHDRLLKPMHGPEILGKLLLHRLQWMAPGRHQGVPWLIEDRSTVVSDAGTAEEVGPLVEKWGTDCVTLVHLTRPGCEWDNRKRFDLPGVRTVELNNAGGRFDIPELVKAALPEVGIVKG